MYTHLDSTVKPPPQVPGGKFRNSLAQPSPAYQEMKVCVRLVELLLKLFNYRGSRICTDLEGTGVNNRGASALAAQQQMDPQPIYGYPSVLQSRPFREGPLLFMDPQEALTSTTDYLVALSHRMDRVFTDPVANLAARRIQVERIPRHSRMQTYPRSGRLGTA